MLQIYEHHQPAQSICLSQLCLSKDRRPLKAGKCRMQLNILGFNPASHSLPIAPSMALICRFPQRRSHESASLPRLSQSAQRNGMDFPHCDAQLLPQCDAQLCQHLEACRQTTAVFHMNLMSRDDPCVICVCVHIRMMYESIIQLQLQAQMHQIRMEAGTLMRPNSHLSPLVFSHEGCHGATHWK